LISDAPFNREDVSSRLKGFDGLAPGERLLSSARTEGTATERHPEVAQFDDTLARIEDVIGFDVAMDDSV
jgi:hypothetical protein